MTDVVLTKGQIHAGARFRRLLQRHAKAKDSTAEALIKHGMGSPEFLEADRLEGELWRKLRAAEGYAPDAGWMD